MQTPRDPRSANAPSELDNALRNCRSAMGVCLGFSFVINILMLASPIYMLQVYDRVLTTGHVETLVMITLIISVAVAVMSVLDVLRNAVTIRIGCWLMERLGPVYLACGIRGRLKGNPSGAQPLRDINQIQNFIATQGLTAFFDSPWVPIFLALIWFLNPILGIIAIVSAFLLFGLSLANEFATRKGTNDANKAMIESTILADVAIRNAEVVHAMGMLPALTRKWLVMNNAVVDGMRRAGDASGVVMALTKFVRLFVQIAVLGVGAYLVLKAEMTAGSMIAASILLGRALAPVEMAIGAWRNFMGARLAYGRLKQMIEAYPTEPRRTHLPAPKGRLEVDNVAYLAGGSGALILNNVSLAIEPGQALAIIGPSGSGKSTLCRLLAGISMPNVGDIKIDGSPIHHWDAAQLASYVGFLPQDVELFSGTVRENISRMQDVDDQQVVNAAMFAHAHEMIQGFPRGYDTQIGDGGIRLSGGQRQRIGLARAVFGGPRLIILDEPNANLDQEGESALARAINKLKGYGATLVIVGHRASTLAQADKILVLKDGAPTMFGSRMEVMQQLSIVAPDNGRSDTLPSHKLLTEKERFGVPSVLAQAELS